MSGFLFRDIVFGPVRSRRFGISLGINLLPLNKKVCSFNCIYCECGLTHDTSESDSETFIPGEIIKETMETKFAELKERGISPDNITFAGNGEPTLHPDFPEIIDATILLRNRFFPEAQITVLSNATTFGNARIKEALLKVDKNVLKLDVGTEDYMKLINNPVWNISLPKIVENLKEFKGNLIIQSLFLRGTVNGEYFDSSSDENVNAWLEFIKEISPRLVMIYPIDRSTPLSGLEKLSYDELNRIAKKVNELGIQTEVYY